MGRTAGRDRLTKKEVLAQLNLWSIEALSDSNDGWVKKHYIDILRDIQDALDSHAADRTASKFEETPDEEMCF